MFLSKGFEKLKRCLKSQSEESQLVSWLMFLSKISNDSNEEGLPTQKENGYLLLRSFRVDADVVQALVLKIRFRPLDLPCNNDWRVGNWHVSNLRRMSIQSFSKLVPMGFSLRKNSISKLLPMLK
jgi:hypothetical protein